MATAILTAVFVLGLPLWLVAEALLARAPVRARVEAARPWRSPVVPSARGGRSTARTDLEHVRS